MADTLQIRELNITPTGRLSLLKTSESVFDKNPNRIENYKGYLRFHSLEHKQKGVLELRSIFVNEECRKKGYGTKFVKWLEKWCRKEGYSLIYIHTSSKKGSIFGDFLVANGYVYYETKIPLGGGWYKKVRKYVKRK